MSHQTLLHRALRPAMRALVPTCVTPDLLTTLRLATGLGAGLCAACGGRLLMAAAGLFLVSAVLDRADGELARQSGRFSRFGWKFDLIADCLSTMAIFVGLGIGTDPALLAPRWWPGSAVAPLLGVVAAVAVAVIFAELELWSPPPTTPRTAPFDADDLMLLVPPALWLWGAAPVLLAAGVLAPITAIVLETLRLRRSRSRRRSTVVARQNA